VNLAEVANVVDEQLKRATDELYAKETALESFKINTITQPSDNVAIQPGVSMATSPVIAAYFTDNRLEASAGPGPAGTHHGEAATRNGRMSPEAIRGAPSLLTNGETAKELQAALAGLYPHQANLRTLRERFTDEYKLVKDELAAITALESEVIPDIGGRLLTELRASETEMNRRIDGRRRNRKIPQRTIESASHARRGRGQHDLPGPPKCVWPPGCRADGHARHRDPRHRPTPPNDIAQDHRRRGARLVRCRRALAIPLDRLDGRFRYGQGGERTGARHPHPQLHRPRSQRMRLRQGLAGSSRSTRPVGPFVVPPGTPRQQR
jgi:hypothetical protein